MKRLTIFQKKPNFAVTCYMRLKLWMDMFELINKHKPQDCYRLCKIGCISDLAKQVFWLPVPSATPRAAPRNVQIWWWQTPLADRLTELSISGSESKNPFHKFLPSSNQLEYAYCNGHFKQVAQLFLAVTFVGRKLFWLLNQVLDISGSGENMKVRQRTCPSISPRLALHGWVWAHWTSQ